MEPKNLDLSQVEVKLQLVSFTTLQVEGCKACLSDQLLVALLLQVHDCCLPAVASGLHRHWHPARRLRGVVQQRQVSTGAWGSGYGERVAAADRGLDVFAMCWRLPSMQHGCEPPAVTCFSTKHPLRRHCTQSVTLPIPVRLPHTKYINTLSHTLSHFF